MTRTTTARITAKHFAFLDDLRESGITNMYGSASYVIEAFGVKRDHAVAIVSAWMRTFDRDKTPEQRVAAIPSATDSGVP